MQYLLRKNTENIEYIENLNPIIADILNKRGIKDANGFLHPSLNALLNPYLFSNMSEAIKKINIATNTNRPIILFSNPEVDGIFSATILYLGLRKICKKCFFYIPNVHKEGYNLSEQIIRNIEKNTGKPLVITTGCGISSYKPIELAKSLGMDVIIIDSHQQKSLKPECCILDAHSIGETYPFKEISSSIIAIKLIQALMGNQFVNKFIDIAAISTIAGEFSLVEENRIVVSKGIDFIKHMKRPGIEALMRQDDISIGDISYKYIPMFKAGCACGLATDIMRLLISTDSQAAKTYADKLEESYKQYKETETNIYIQALNMVGESDKKSLVLFNDKWDINVLSSVSNKISEKYKKPCILFSTGTDGLIGVFKDGKNTNWYDSFSKCKTTLSVETLGSDIVINIKKDELEFFKKEFESICSSKTDKEEKVICDVKLKMSDIDRKLYDAIESMQPFGIGNPSVKIMLSDISMKNVIIRAGKHFSASIFDETGICDAICFNSVIPSSLDDLDMVITLGLNKYRGKEKIQCQIFSFMHNGKNLRKAPISLITNYGVRVVDQPIEVLGLNDRKVKQFLNAGIDSIQKLINYLPTKYNDFRYAKNSKDISIPEVGSIIGIVNKVNVTPKITYAMCKDENGDTFMACWFHQEYVARMLTTGNKYIFCGKLSKSDRGMPQVFPMYFSMDINKYKTIIPEYKKITGMSSEYLIQSIDKALQLTPNTDFLDLDIVEKFHIMSDYDATIKLHHPKNDFEIRDGQRRKVFNELFEFNFILKSRNKSNIESRYLLKDDNDFDRLKSILPYNLTNDQDNCIKSIYEYTNSGKILNALVQGDVGSGKTMVALFSMLLAINNGYQACLIAPTEVLAQQHYTEISGYLEELGYKTGYLVGGMKVKERRAVLSGLKDGSINAVIGTHAIIQKDVEFSELAIAVVDEQHKFGVAQREKLANIEGPHMISMSATPIPRTLSMATYGDNIQVYSIKEKPAGRKNVITMKMFSDNDVNNFMLDQIRQGRQCYVVCPMIDDSEVDALSGVRSVKQEAEAMIKWFSKYPEVKISNATGRMRKELIAEEIDKFTKNETNILISTTIIEVGVNVPNATIMVLKSSERFGLAQAHQLRGRVGRGNHQSYCLLQTDMDDPKADILCETTDGFEIARQDMLLRGSGDYIGTQQTGNNRNVMLMMSEPELYKSISKINDEIYKDPAKFAKYSYILDKAKESEDIKI